MTSHISEELPRLLTGEAPRDVVDAAASHLRTCADCQQELVSAVVAHASLTSAQRFAPELVASFRQLTLTEQHGGDKLPDLSTVFAQVRDEAAQTAVAPHGRRHRTFYAVAGLAAAAIVGGTSFLIVDNTGSSPAKRTISLSAFGTGHTSAKADLIGKDDMKITATSLPKLSESQRYEVWLTNDNRTQMQPVGWIGLDGTAQLTVPANLMSAFSAIEVSVQALDASTYTYSGTSVLRGSYNA